MPKLRWEDGVMDDARKLGKRNWRNAARNKDSGREASEEGLGSKLAVVPMMMTMMMMMIIMIVSIIVKKSSYKHVPNSEWLPR